MEKELSPAKALLQTADTQTLLKAVNGEKVSNFSTASRNIIQNFNPSGFYRHDSTPI